MELTEFPQLVKEWHPTKNGHLRPENFTHGSGKRVWWKCPKGDDHVWQATIANRTNGTQCPFCSGNRVSKSNSFLTHYPEVAKEWHPTKNGHLRPENFTQGSGKRVWWKCPKGDDHVWLAAINDRRRDGCPFCAGKKVGKDNNLLFKYPDIAKEWHPVKNKNLKPKDYYFGSNKKVWWKCPKGKDHEWYISPYARISGSNCPFCFGKKTSKDNSLPSKYPEIAKEWHPTKNENWKAEDVRPHSGKRAWWQCPNDKSHEYQAIIGNRTKGFGCPFCSGSSTSEPEVRVFSELSYLFGIDNVSWRRKVDGVELDIFMPKYNLGVEFDGSYWHKDKLQSDTDKNKFFQEKGIQVIRIREEPLEFTSSNDISSPKNSLSKKELNNLVLKIKSLVKTSEKLDFDAYIGEPSFLNEKGFNRFISFFPDAPPEYSIVNTHPEIATQWHSYKNGELKPEQFTYGSDRKAWWKCPKGKDHEWISTISNRTNGNGCPFCSGLKPSQKYNLLVTHPEICKEWDNVKNKLLRPEDFTFGSDKVVWWLCPKGHSYDMRIASRTRKKSQGCPYCSGRRSLTKDLFD